MWALLCHQVWHILGPHVVLCWGLNYYYKHFSVTTLQLERLLRQYLLILLGVLTSHILTVTSSHNFFFRIDTYVSKPECFLFAHIRTNGRVRSMFCKKF
jgi:hypothetical protein